MAETLRPFARARRGLPDPRQRVNGKLAAHLVMRHAGTLIARGFRTLCLAGAIAVGVGQPARSEAMVFGWVETLELFPGRLVVDGKLDTGAERSSVHAQGLEVFERDEERWARFSISSPHGGSESFERRVVGTAAVRRAGAATQHRPVVVLGICLGSVYRDVEVTLADRTGMEYEVLVGRNFLAGAALVDSDRRHTAVPSCED